MNDIDSVLLQYGKQGTLIGIIGVGAFGELIRIHAEKLGFNVMLNDPPREEAESEEEYDEIFTQWGNGMGGCTYTPNNSLTFLPLNVILPKVSLIAVQVPLTDRYPNATRGMIDREFLSQVKPDTVILNFSEKEIIADGIADSRIVTICGIE